MEVAQRIQANPRLRPLKKSCYLRSLRPLVKARAFGMTPCLKRGLDF
jgi:hypothetical protein